nr:hypothetical protein [Tanacetum cinerariifolium]
MHTRSSSNLPVESPPNPSTSNPKRHKRRRSKQPFILEESPVDTMDDQRTMAELLCASTEGYAEAIVTRTQDVLTIIKNKSKFCNSRNKSVVSQVKSSDANSSSYSEIAKLTHAVNQQTSAVTTAMTAILIQFQATSHLAFVKSVEEIYVTCGGAHPYYRCLATDGNTFSEIRDNIQGYVAAAAVNYNKDQVVPLSELEKAKRMNEANMKAMQTQINNVKNEFRNEMKNSIQASMSNQTNELKNMMASFFQMNNASTSGSRHLPSNTIANPKGELKAITTRSGIVLDGTSVPIPPPFINPKEDERVEETLTDQDLTEDPLHPNIPYPLRMLKQKQQEKDEVQIHKFWQMFKQLHINITLADALILILKYQKMFKALLSNKDKLLELANTPLNENCSAVILKKLPEKLGDPGKFLILCGFSELKYKALFDLGASINLMPLFVWIKLGLPELISTRMTLELANRAICTPAGIAGDVFILVGKFTFPADFVIFDYESDPRVPLILGRPFLRTARALIDVHKEDMILCDGDERLTLNIRHDTSSYSNQPQKESINMINICDDLTTLFVEKSDTSLSYSDNSLPKYKTFSNHMEETDSASTTTHAYYSLPKYDSFFEIEPDQGKLTSVVMKDNLAEPRVHKNSGSTTIHADISLLDLECFSFKIKPDPGELTSLVNSEIRANVPSANVNLPPEEDHSTPCTYVVWIFLSFLTYPMVPPNLLSFENKDTIFDPGISNYHFPSLLPDLSHRCETFMKFNVYPKLLNESPMEILSSTCSSMVQ